jgi:protein-disulfide isomerase
MKKLTLLAAALLVSACGDKGNDNAATSNGSVTPVAAPNGGDWTKTVSLTPEGGMRMGNPDAKVKLVEYGSLTCPHCAEFAEKGEPQLVDKYVKTGQVSYEFRNFVRDPLDITMSLIARCGGASPQFFQLSNAMYSDQKSIFDKLQSVPQQQLASLQSQAPVQQFQAYAKFAGLQEWAAQRGLPSAKTSACLSNQQEIEKLVQMNSDAVSQYNLPGTPTFLINGEVVPETATWDKLEPKLKEAVGG